MPARRPIRLLGALLLVVVTAGCGSSSARAAGAAHPFPTHVGYRLGVMPSASQAARDAAVRHAYDAWKRTYLVPGCARGEYVVSTRGDGNHAHGGPVSEGQGYGMNIVPLMAGYDPAARAEFAGLWSFVQHHRDAQGMMQWTLDGRTCRYADTGRPDGATDGDLDIGYGLMLADAQWGGYRSAALAWLAKVWAADVAPDGHLKPEDDDSSASDTRPSDFMLDHLRAFAAFDRAHDWNKVVRRTESIITEFTQRYSPKTGLLSDFVIGADTTHPRPAEADHQEDQPDNIVGYNSIRVPWHLGTDALVYGQSRARVSLATATAGSRCLNRQSSGVPARVTPHTNLDCSRRLTDASGDSDAVAEEAGDCIGPAAMAAGDQAWTDAIWAALARNPFHDHYFGETLKMLVYLVMAGDYWHPDTV